MGRRFTMNLELGWDHIILRHVLSAFLGVARPIPVEAHCTITI